MCFIYILTDIILIKIALSVDKVSVVITITSITIALIMSYRIIAI